jgi:hypothetical protein
MYVPVTELEIVGVYDRGVANLERVAFRVKQGIDTTPFGVLAGLYQTDGTRTAAVPINDHFFWFGNAWVSRGEWILLYTGPGTARKTTLLGSKTTAYVCHWNKPTTIFANSSIVPVLVRIGGVVIESPPADVVQHELLK